MKLVIDCFKLIKGTGKSIGIYNLTRNLVEQLALHRRKEDTIIVLGTRHNQEDFRIPGVRFVSVKYDPRNKLICILWELYLVTIALKRLKADRVLFPRGFAPLWHPAEDYVIVHDMIPFYYDKEFPGVLNPLENFYIMWRLKSSIRYSHGVITDSQASKEEILCLTGVAEEKVQVVYPGQNQLDLSAIKEADVSSELDKLEGQDYVCAITSGLPHKNATGILKSYERYCNLCRMPLPMVIIGLENVNAYDVPDEIKKHIICIKYLKEDAQMYKVVMESNVFLFLSLQEGFGFPPLEAMQLGVPVICSNKSSLPEVTGMAAELVDPKDTNLVAESLKCLIEDKKRQDSLREKGYVNINRFLWKNCIEDYMRILFYP